MKDKNKTPFRSLLRPVIAGSALLAFAFGASQLSADTITFADPIEAAGNYTHNNNLSTHTDGDGAFELNTHDGGNFMRWSSTGGQSRQGTVQFTEGFDGGSLAIQPGEYTVSIEVGRGVLDPPRATFTTFELQLVTLDGEEIGEPTIVEEYVAPDQGEWTTVTVSYTVSPDSNFIGQQLTWRAEFFFEEDSDSNELGAVDHVRGEIEPDPEYLTEFDEFEAPFTLDFGQDEDTEEGLIISRTADFSLQEDALRYQPGVDTFITSTALASVENYIERQEFTLEADMTVAELDPLADNRVGLAVLGGPHSPPEEFFNASGDAGFYGLMWYPSDEDGNSVLMIREGFNGEILAEAPWEGRAPLGQPVVLLFEDFEDTTAAAQNWETDGDLWEFGQPVFSEGEHEGPESAYEGDNVAGTGLDRNYPENTNAGLRSPVIDLTGIQYATLTFQEFTEVDDFEGETMWHNMTITVLEAGSLNEIVELDEYDGATGEWNAREYVLPEDTLGQEVVIEFRLESDTLDGDTFAGWFIDNVEVVGLPEGEAGSYTLEAHGIFDIAGFLDLTFTLTDEDGFSESITGSSTEPHAGNLFGFGGRSRSNENATFDFHSLSLTVGQEPEPIVPTIEAPFAYAFGTGEGRDDSDDFLSHPEADWNLTDNALRFASDAADYENAIAHTRVLNFEAAEPFFLEADATLENLDSTGGEHRLGLVLFGVEDPNVYNPQDDATFHTFQWSPGEDRIALREGFDGAVLAETSLAELDAPPAVSAGATYNFRLVGSFSGGNFEFTGVFSDGLGGAATLSGSMAAPAPDHNRFGFGVRHTGADNPVWDFHNYSWAEEAPLPMPLHYRFGSDAGRNSDDDFVKTGHQPSGWTLEEQTLRTSRSGGSTEAGNPDATAAAEVFDATPGMDFAMQATVTGDGAIIASGDTLPFADPIESHGDYTHDNNMTQHTDGDGSFDLNTHDGGNFMRWSSTGGQARQGTVILTDGFEEGQLPIVPGEYTVSIEVGRGVLDPPRATFSTFEFRLTTLDGDEIGERVVIDEYEIPDEGEWDTITISYSIGEDSPYIGEALTWQADFTFEADGGSNELGAVDHVRGEIEPQDDESIEYVDSRIGLSFLGDTGEADTAHRVHWYPLQDELAILGPEEAGVLASQSTGGSIEYAEGGTYTMKVTGNYNGNGGLDLTTVITDENDGEVSWTTEIAFPDGLPLGRHFGMSSRHPILEWHEFHMGTPEQLDNIPDEPEAITFAEWQEDQFGAETDPDIIGPLATPANDGVANLLKYAFGLDAMTPVGGADLPQAEMENGTLTLTYLERHGADIAYIPEMSLDLNNDWDADDVQEVGRTQVDAEFDRVTVEAVLPDGAQRGFLRVNVTQD